MKKITLFPLFTLLFCWSFSQNVCPDSTRLGMASNLFTHILNETNPVIFNNDLNTVIFIHRHNTVQFGGHSGNLRYDISTDGGATWTLNQGVLNPASINGSNAARYPNVSLYNPPGNTVPDSAYLVYQAATVATTWNGVCTGVRQLDGTGNTENYNQAASTLTLIPRAHCEGKPGEFWAIDAIWNGTVATGFRVLKGVWNATTKDVVWSINRTLIPPFNATSGNPVSSDFCIAFDPSGDIGWVCILTHITPGPAAQAFYPVFYHTTDGGVTWSGPEQVDIGDFQCITNNIGATNVPTTAFDLDLEVDMHGIPHALVGVGNGSNAYGIFYTQWHAMFDITRLDGIWNAIELDTLNAGRATFGTTPNPTTTLDQFSQSSRTEDGSKIFFTYTDSRQGLIGGENIVPDLYGIAYDAQNRRWTTRRNMTDCSAALGGEIFYPHISPIAKNGPGTGVWTLPMVYAELNATGEPVDPSSFLYADSLQFTTADFFIPLCSIPVSISTVDTIRACGSAVLDGGANHDAYLWSTGDTTQTVTVTASGTYSLGIRDVCCTGSDTVVVIIDPAPVASFGATANSLAVSFSDSSSGLPSGWLWDFGDGDTSSLQNPQHTYPGTGNYQVCLIVTNPCGADTICDSVNVTCPAPVAGFAYSTGDTLVTFADTSSGTGSSFYWDFGDSTFSTSQNPSHVYAGPGQYWVCFSVMDSCGADTICDSVTVTCQAPAAVLNIDSVVQITAWFSVGSTAPGNSYFWTFGDGFTSTDPNPSHIYTADGNWEVCLTVSNICGANTVCDSITTASVGGVAHPSIDRVRVYPVPAEDRLLVSGVVSDPQSLSVRLTDLVGREVQSWGNHHVNGAFTIQLELGSLSSGAYLLHLSGKDGQVVRKVLKE